MLLLFEGIVTVLRGDAQGATPMLLELGATPEIAPSPMAGHVAIGLYWADALQAAEDLINSTIEFGLSSRAPGFYTHAAHRASRSVLAHWTLSGRAADASEALRLATDAGRPILLGYATSMLARAEASLGRVELARELVAEAADYGGFVGRLWSQSDAGFIELTADNPADAIPYLERASRFCREEGLRLLSPSPWGPDLVEAYVRVGRTADADRPRRATRHRRRPAPEPLVTRRACTLRWTCRRGVRRSVRSRVERPGTVADPVRDSAHPSLLWRASPSSRPTQRRCGRASTRAKGVRGARCGSLGPTRRTRAGKLGPDDRTFPLVGVGCPHAKGVSGRRADRAGRHEPRRRAKSVRRHAARSKRTWRTCIGNSVSTPDPSSYENSQRATGATLKTTTPRVTPRRRLQHRLR